MPTKRHHFSLFLPLICMLSGSVLAQSLGHKVDIKQDVTATPVAPQASNPSASQGIKWNFEHADIRSIIDLMAKTTHHNYVIDPDVHGTISIVAPQAMDAAQSQQVFESALKTLGYTTIPQGPITRIVAMHDADHMVGATPSGTTSNNTWVVQVLPITHVSASQLAPILRPMLSEHAHIFAYNPSNTLVIAGPNDDIKRMVSIIKQVDHDNNRQIDIIALHHSEASRIATVISQLQSSDRNLGKLSPVSVVADTSSNSILLSGPKQDKLAYRVLISKLDTPNTPSSSHGNTEVIYLNYLKAKQLAPMLSHMLTNDNIRQSSTAIRTSIEAETNTNSIIVHAAPAAMQSLKEVIRELDVRPAQVAVEAIIAQVDEGTSQRLGITWGINDQSGGHDTTSGNGGAIGSIGFQAGVGVIHRGSLQAVIYALRGNNATDVLSTPSVVVMDNQPASISVGKDVAVDNRTYAMNDQNSSSYTPFTNTEYKKVALSLDVTPQISPDGGVQLNLTQTNDTLQDPTDPGTRPVINTSKINTTVLVNDGDILVLGGLTSHDVEQSVAKIPILGDIPIIRPLFSYKKNTVVKKNLMVFLKPIILHDTKSGVRFTRNKYDWILHQEQQHQHKQPLIDGDNTPSLPAFETQLQGPHLPKPFAP